MLIELFFTESLKNIHLLYGNYFVVVVVSLFLVVATIYDIKFLRIPDKLNLAFFISRLLIIPWFGLSWSNLEGALLGFFVLLIPAMIKMHPMGGDIKNMTVLGLFAGIHITILIIGLSCTYGLIYGLSKLILAKKSGLMPFAPFFLISFLTLFVVSFFR